MKLYYLIATVLMSLIVVMIILISFHRRNYSNIDVDIDKNEVGFEPKPKPSKKVKMIYIDKNDTKTLNKWRKKNSKIHHTLKDLMGALDGICQEFNIPYWIAGGTLLGQYRHQGFIPWDDDIDINILEDDLAKLEFVVDHYYPDYSITVSKKMKVHKFKKNGCKYFIDLLPFRKGKKVYNFTNPIHRNAWPNGYFKGENLYPIKKCKFDDLTVSCPNISDDYLDRHYGNDWKDIYKVTHTHF